MQALQAVQGQLTALKAEQPEQKAEIEVVEGKLVEVVEASQKSLKAFFNSAVLF